MERIEAGKYIGVLVNEKNSNRLIKEIGEWIKDEVNLANKDGVIIGISGGIDSAVTSVIAGLVMPKKVIGIYFSSYDGRYFDPNNPDLEGDPNKIYVKDLTLLNEDIIQLKIVNNTRMIVDKVFHHTILYLGDEKKERDIKSNILSRLYMTQLYALAQELNCLVLGTTNFTEFMLGYFTKYGDGGTDLEPLRRFYKSDIYALASVINKEKKRIPDSIMERKPTPMLYGENTSEDELLVEFTTADAIIANKYDTLLNPYTNLLETCERESVISIQNIISKNEHKRNMPPEFKKFRIIRD